MGTRVLFYRMGDRTTRRWNMQKLGEQQLFAKTFSPIRRGPPRSTIDNLICSTSTALFSRILLPCPDLLRATVEPAGVLLARVEFYGTNKMLARAKRAVRAFFNPSRPWQRARVQPVR